MVIEDIYLFDAYGDCNKPYDYNISDKKSVGIKQV